MERPKRNAVFVASPDTIGRDLVFKHYTSKVVAAIYPERKKLRPTKNKKELKIQLKQVNAYSLEVMKNCGWISMYENYLKRKSA